jgi:hypothetical protein
MQVNEKKKQMQNLINNQVKNMTGKNKQNNQSLGHHGSRSKSATSMNRRPNTSFEPQESNKNGMQNI